MTRNRLSAECWQFSSKAMTVMVLARDGKVVDAAPIIKRFVGQQMSALEKWMIRQGGFRKTLLRPTRLRKAR